jgi:O-antigen/teichoic acid export membrane protein
MSKLSSNILYNFVGQSILLVLGFLSVKYIYRLLGEDALGIIYFTATLNVILCGVLEKGLYATTVREISSYYGTDSDYILKFMRTGVSFCFAIFIVFAVLMYFAAPLLVGKWINLRSMTPGTAMDIIRILGISSLLAFPRSYFASVFRGLQRMEYNNIIDVVVSFFQQTGTISLLLTDRGIYAVSAWLAFCYLMSLAAYMICTSLFFPGKAMLPGFSAGVFRRVQGFAAKTASISLLSTIQKQVDKVVMSKMLPIGIVGYYGFAYSVTSKAGIIVSAVTNAAYPSFSEIYKNGNWDELKKQYRKLQEFILLSTIPVFAAVIFSAIPITTFMLSKDIAWMLIVPFVFLAMGFYLNGTLNLLYQLSLAVGRPDIGMRSNFYAFFIATPATIFLTYSFGLTGAAFSWVAFNVVYMYVFFLPIACREIFKDNLLKWYLSEIRFFAVALVSYGAAWAVLSRYELYSLMGFSMAYLIATTVFFSVVISFISRDASLLIFDYLRKAFGFVRVREET